MTFKIYSTTVSLVLLLLIFVGWKEIQSLKKFDTIQVQRINIVEPDGTLKMVISNREKFPDEIAMDGWTKKHNRNTPGILFYNAEGVESGGLIYSSEVDDKGNISAGNHLSFDRYKQDQTIALTYQEANGKYTSGLSFIDRPEKSLAALEREFETATSKQKDSMRSSNAWGISRIWLGTANNKPDIRGSFLVMNSDKRTNTFLLSVDEEAGLIQFMGKNGVVRLSLGLDNSNNPIINFYDEKGNLSKKIN